MTTLTPPRERERSGTGSGTGSAWRVIVKWLSQDRKLMHEKYTTVTAPQRHSGSRHCRDRDSGP